MIAAYKYGVNMSIDDFGQNKQSANPLLIYQIQWASAISKLQFMLILLAISFIYLWMAFLSSIGIQMFHFIWHFIQNK